MTNGADQADFLITKEYRRFAEFCDACHRNRYIGICYGPPGVGKTLSARHFAHWDLIEKLSAEITRFVREDEPVSPPPPPEVLEYRTAVYTPDVDNNPSRIYGGVNQVRTNLGRVIEKAMWAQKGVEDYYFDNTVDKFAELLIVDEADRLKMSGLETVRDIYDRKHLGLVLIGMPGIEKRLARYPQFYSRVGFVHEYKALSVAEMRFILEHKWEQLGLTLKPDDFTDSEAMATITRITGGNFRLIQRLFAQIERIMQINELKVVTKEVVEAARESLVIGTM